MGSETNNWVLFQTLPSSSSFPTAQLNPTSSGDSYKTTRSSSSSSKSPPSQTPELFHTRVVVSGPIHDLAVSRLSSALPPPRSQRPPLCFGDLLSLFAILMSIPERYHPGQLSLARRNRCLLLLPHAATDPHQLYTFALLVRHVIIETANDSKLLGKDPWTGDEDQQ
ncbi:hypothetical protein HPP92_018645 [Vanilla planifolia]|uniref:Uncharacterized protein n=1 Tax=Vanilla planifolia TaxID=51239 RepID=A0A835UNJ8_VANPL|nr:hypothetical protein HPP92_018645 [Vanilla planifolia]